MAFPRFLKAQIIRQGGIASRHTTLTPNWGAQHSQGFTDPPPSPLAPEQWNNQHHKCCLVFGLASKQLQRTRLLGAQSRAALCRCLIKSNSSSQPSAALQLLPQLRTSQVVCSAGGRLFLSSREGCSRGLSHSQRVLHAL